LLRFGRLLTLGLATTIVAAGFSAGVAGAASHPTLPAPHSRLIVPNVGIGGVRLGQRLSPLPRGWKHPAKCQTGQGLKICYWTDHTQRDVGPAHPLSGPVVYITAYRNRIVRFELSVHTGNPARSALSHWRTGRKIGIGSGFASVAAAYGPGGPGTSPTVYDLPGSGRQTNTLFGNAGGIVNDIEIDACSSINPC